VLHAVFRLSATVADFGQAGEPVARVADPPLRAVPMVQPSWRLISRVAVPTAANSTIRARRRMRTSLFVLRHSVSSCIRSAWVRVIAVAEEIVLIHSLNHDALFSDSGY
jgi:hypothetical protein